VTVYCQFLSMMEMTRVQQLHPNLPKDSTNFVYFHSPDYQMSDSLLCIIWYLCACRLDGIEST
jgi:hypothetical protein